MIIDHVVPHKDRYHVAAIVSEVRNHFADLLKGGRVDPVSLLIQLTRASFSKKGALLIDFIEHNDDKPAWVTYEPLTLHVSKSVWHNASTLDAPFDDRAQARWILFHELGHIFLHDGKNSRPFTSDHSKYTKLPSEISAETQADLFGLYLAADITDRLTKFDICDLATLYELPENICETMHILASTHIAHKIIPTYSTVLCSQCGHQMKCGDGVLQCDACDPPITIVL